MRTSRWTRFAAVSLTMAMAVSACGGRDDDTSTGGGGGGNGGGEASGDTIVPIDDCPTDPTAVLEGDTIKLGSSFPQSGIYAAFAEISAGWTAYFDYINDQGGVDGKMIEVVTEDDEYLPERTVSNAQKLISQDDVFALFNIVGTPNNDGVRKATDALCVPNLYVATGSQLWGDDAEEFPWTVGSIPSYPTEAAVFATYLEETNPDAEVAILFQDDDFGEGYRDAFEVAIEGTDITIVGEEGIAPGGSPNAAVATLKATGADTLLAAVTTIVCPNTLAAAQEVDWAPQVYISATCTSNILLDAAPDGSKDNLISSLYIKAPDDPQWADDEAIVEFKEIGAEYGLTDIQIDNGIVTYGWAMGELMVRTLELAAENGGISRMNVLEAARSLQDERIEVLLPGVMINSDGFDDPFIIEAMQVGQYDPEQAIFELQGELQDFEGQTGDFSPGG